MRFAGSGAIASLATFTAYWFKKQRAAHRRPNTTNLTEVHYELYNSDNAGNVKR